MAASKDLERARKDGAGEGRSLFAYLHGRRLANAEMLGLLSDSLGHVAARLGFGSVHEIKPQDCFFSQDLGVEAVAVIGLVLDEAAVINPLPIVGAGDGREGEEGEQDAKHGRHQSPEGEGRARKRPPPPLGASKARQT